MNIATPYFPFCMIIWAVNCEDDEPLLALSVIARRPLPSSSSSEHEEEELEPREDRRLGLFALLAPITGTSEDDVDSSMITVPGIEYGCGRINRWHTCYINMYARKHTFVRDDDH